MEIRKVKFVTGLTTENGLKRQKLELYPASFSRECDNAVENCDLKGEKAEFEMEKKDITLPEESIFYSDENPKFGHASVCGRRRDMEDAVAIHPWFYGKKKGDSSELHYFGVYDGHGCSHVAMRCKDRLHELVKEELEDKVVEFMDWKEAMERSFSSMDSEVVACKEGVLLGASCRCELQAPESDAVGSTAVVAIVTPEKIIVANCGDSRAVLCRNGKAIPLSTDHKPDRPDELNRIQASGGRVIYWDGPRVLGVLAMSRAIGDNYLKPYVSCEPEVTITYRTAEDECLILASDGLWDVVSNETACGVARMCLKGKVARMSTSCSPENETGGENPDQSCSDASTLLTKLALARRSSDNVSVVVIDLRKAT